MLCAWLLSLNLQAQDHRFMVFFTDKNSSFTLDEPLEFLSQRALDRRTNQNIALTEQDLPVSPLYIQGVEDLGVSVWYPSKWFNGVLIETDSSQLAAISGLAFVSSIEFVAPGPLTPRMGRVRSSKYKGNSKASTRTQSSDFQNQLLGIDEMHQLGIRGQGMFIAVFDGGFSGVDTAPPFDHLQSNGQLKSTFDFVGNSTDVFRYSDHGTRALSVIAAQETGTFTGGAYEADYLLCVTEDVASEYRVEEYNWAFAAEMADSAGVDIINTSLGYNTFDDPSMNYTVDDLDGQTAIISQAATIAATKGMVLTVSAGNSGNSFWQRITTPADAIDILAVGAITSDSSKASFSSIGPSADGRIKPEVSALGVGTAVINSGGNLVFNNGTSFSAPQVASLVAGIWQNNANLDYLQVIELVKNSGNQALNPDEQLGYGIPNFTRAGQLILSTDDDDLQRKVSLFPNPVGDQLYLQSTQPLPQATLVMHTTTGQTVLENQLQGIPAQQQITIDLPALNPGIYLVVFQTPSFHQTFKLIKR